MILIGQYDSPFVRRVAVALKFYGLEYEHRAWSVFANADDIAEYNPLIRVPTLVLDDGEVLVESASILDALDEMVGPEKAMFPKMGPRRRRALKVAALATGLADKAVSLVYERVVHGRATDAWVQRCERQIKGVLAVLEEDRGGHDGPWWMGADFGHADIAVACAVRFLIDAHGDLFQIAGWPALERHWTACEDLPEFRDCQQKFHIRGVD